MLKHRSMSSTCPFRCAVEDCSSFYKESAIVQLYHRPVSQSAMVDDMLHWSEGIPAGAVWFRQKHDYVVLWRESPQKQVVVYHPYNTSLHRNDRFSRSLIRRLGERRFSFGQRVEYESPCRCGLLIENFLDSWILNPQELSNLFEGAQYHDN